MSHSEQVTMKIGVSDYISSSHFPILLAQELGLYEKEGLSVVVRAYEQAAKELDALRDGDIDLASVGAHHPLTVFKGWKGAKLLMAVGQCTPWALVVRAQLLVQRGDFKGLEGLRIGAAPEPEKALRYILRKAGVDLDRAQITTGPVPGALAPGACTGVAAAKALETGQLDGFWTNQLGVALAVQSGAGKVFADIRHGEGPPGADKVSFTALVATDRYMAKNPESVGKAICAVVKAQGILRESPEQAGPVARRLFPEEAAAVVPGIVEANKDFYHAEITAEDMYHLHQFAKEVGLLTEDVPYEESVALRFMPFWGAQALPS